MLRSNHIIKRVFRISFISFLVLLFFWLLRGSVWSIFDYQLLDEYYFRAVNSNYGPESTDQIVYLIIDDETYRDYFRKNVLDRYLLSKVIDTLYVFQPEAVAADMIFAYPSDSFSDEKLYETFISHDNIYLPVAFALGMDESGNTSHLSIRGKEDLSFYKLPQELNSGRAYVATRAMTQYEKFSAASGNSGHISVINDDDGILRHSMLLIKVDSMYYPSLALSMYLDYMGISMEDLIIE